MPWKSKAQMRWMWANHPEMAKKWAKHTPNPEKLPEKVGKLKRLGFKPIKQRVDDAYLGINHKSGGNIYKVIGVNAHHVKYMQKKYPNATVLPMRQALPLIRKARRIADFDPILKKRIRGLKKVTGKPDEVNAYVNSMLDFFPKK